MCTRQVLLEQHPSKSVPKRHIVCRRAVCACVLYAWVCTRSAVGGDNVASVEPCVRCNRCCCMPVAQVERYISMRICMRMHESACTGNGVFICAFYTHVCLHAPAIEAPRSGPRKYTHKLLRPSPVCSPSEPAMAGPNERAGFMLPPERWPDARIPCRHTYF